jgi:hypothetical protein
MYTVQQIEADLYGWQGTYSDLFKGLHGFRPRGDMLNTADMICSFLNSYEENFRYSQEQEAEELAALGDQHGRVFRNWHEYYDMLERKDAREREEYFAEMAEEEAEQREFNRRGSPMPFIIDWEHGRNEFRVC